MVPTLQIHHHVRASSHPATAAYLTATNGGYPCSIIQYIDKFEEKPMIATKPPWFLCACLAALAGLASSAFAQTYR